MTSCPRRKSTTFNSECPDPSNGIRWRQDDVKANKSNATLLQKMYLLSADKE